VCWGCDQGQCHQPAPPCSCLYSLGLSGVSHARQNSCLRPSSDQACIAQPTVGCAHSYVQLTCRACVSIRVMSTTLSQVSPVSVSSPLCKGMCDVTVLVYPCLDHFLPNHKQLCEYKGFHGGGVAIPQNSLKVYTRRSGMAMNSFTCVPCG
jgi:hypothetical protein